MKKYFLILFCSTFMFSQNVKVTYVKSSNGKLIENQDPIIVFASKEKSIISTEKIEKKTMSFPYEKTLVLNSKKLYIQQALLTENKIIQTIDSLSFDKQSFEITKETRTILGYKCKKARTIINSNTIDLWYTDELQLSGAPTILGQKLGLVLEYVRNGNFVIAAKKIEKANSLPEFTIYSNPLDLLSYRDVLWKSRFVTIPVFKNQVINFTKEQTPNDTVMQFANGTIALRKIKFPKIKSGSQVFASIEEQSNGDAYDRTGCLFIIPQEREISFYNGLTKGINTLPSYENGNGKKYQGVVQTGNYLPPVELVRFFTPFGIDKFNHIELKGKQWFDKVFYRQDITDLISLIDDKEVYIGIFIGNYDKGGHKVSAEITIHPEEIEPKKDKKTIPLFCTNNIMEMAGQEYGTMFNSNEGLKVTFQLDKAMKNCQLRYITTGHGGWENGDEFVPKLNTIFLNGKIVHQVIPWRQDCGSYRLYNPASGNFQNGLSSSDYSRSNWCPGTVTYPMYIELGDLEAGNNTIQITIPQGKPEGSSFSAWNISGVLIGE